MKYIPCPDCGLDFLQDAPWKRRCLSCWQELKIREAAQARPTVTIRDDAQIAALREENAKLATEVAEWKQRALKAESRSKFDSDMLRRLIQLCHPDKHDNSKASQIATQFLIDLRGRYS